MGDEKPELVRFEIEAAEIAARFVESKFAEPVAAADGGRDVGFSELTVSERGRRC